MTPSANPAGPNDAKARFLSAIDTIRDVRDDPQRLCSACVLTLPVQRAGILLNVSGTGLDVLSASDAVAEKAEWTQVTLGEGPAVESIATGLPMSLADPHRSDRWPVFLSEIKSLDVGGIYAFPLNIGVIRVGALDLYTAVGDPLGAQDFADALAIAEILTGVLLSMGPDGLLPQTLGPWWNQPVSSREVHQATGMVMAQLGVDARSAYVRLQAFAFVNGRLLNDVAGEVVSRRLRFQPEPDDGLSSGRDTPIC